MTMDKTYMEFVVPSMVSCPTDAPPSSLLDPKQVQLC
jgi:hypothetical protein